jgi:hypothetical protein
MRTEVALHARMRAITTVSVGWLARPRASILLGITATMDMYGPEVAFVGLGFRFAVAGGGHIAPRPHEPMRQESEVFGRLLTGGRDR